jgi:hypothetical protein
MIGVQLCARQRCADEGSTMRDHPTSPPAGDPGCQSSGFSVRAPAVTRRAVVAAAWSAPVILAAAAAPAAAASVAAARPTLVWIGSPGVFAQQSALYLDVPADSPDAGQPGTLTLTNVGYGGTPSMFEPPAGWTFTTDYANAAIIATTPALGAGPNFFRVTWPIDSSGNGDYLAVWQSSEALPPVSSPVIEVGPQGFPSLAWSENPAEFGGTSTLTLSVPSTNKGIGFPANILGFGGWPAVADIQLPAGWTFETLTSGGQQHAVLHTEATVKGDTHFVFAFVEGTVETTIDPTWLGSTEPGNYSPMTPITAAEPLRIVPA